MNANHNFVQISMSSLKQCYMRNLSRIRQCPLDEILTLRLTLIKNMPILFNPQNIPLSHILTTKIDCFVISLWNFNFGHCSLSPHVTITSELLVPKKN